MTTPTAATSSKSAKHVPHHLFVDGKPLCGVKGKALVAMTAATPVHVACGRCLRAAKSRNIGLPVKTDAPVAAPVAKLETVKAAPVAAPVKAAPVKAAPVAAPVKAAPKAKPAAKAESKASHAELLAAAMKAVPTFLLNPEYKLTESGKVDTITGVCPICKTHKRTIHAADAFQVKRCEHCQKKEIARRINEYRKAKRAEARKAAGSKAK